MIYAYIMLTLLMPLDDIQLFWKMALIKCIALIEVRMITE